MDNVPTVRLRINPGGTLKPEEVIGRDGFALALWETLEHQSVMLTAERRMGKTSVLLKLEHEPVPRTCVIKRTLQGTRSPEDFVQVFIADVEKAIPGALTKSLGDRLFEAGIKKIGSSPLSVEFAPRAKRSWKEILIEVLAVLDEDVDERVLLLWDELPQMISDIAQDHGPGPAREMLDILRASRETHSGIRMVLSGSLGIHHVVSKLRSEGAMWMPTHDMRLEDLPPLPEPDANFLAGELLRNERIDCDDLDAVVTRISVETDCIPFYIHQTALSLRNLQRNGQLPLVTEASVRDVVEDATQNALDPWELGHYLERTPIYYGDDSELVNRILDHIARMDSPQTIKDVEGGLAAQGPPPARETTHRLLALLCKDYYLRETSDGYVFLRTLVRRSWIAKRPPGR